MNSQDESSKPQKPDMIFPTIMTGLCLFYVCICICMCAALLLINKIPPITDLFEPTLIPISCPAIPAGWQRIMKNDFANNRYVWPVGKNTNSYDDTDLQIVDGLLRFDVKAHQGVYNYQIPSFDSRYVEDSYITAQARKVSGPRDAEYGLVFRVQDEKQLFFSIQDSGSVQVYTRDAMGDWGDLLFTGRSNNINVGDTNQLVVFVQGNNYTFCVNQYVVGEVNNSDYPYGESGIAVELRKANDEASFEYDDYMIYVPVK